MTIKIQSGDLRQVLRTLQLADKAATVIFDTGTGTASVVGGKLSLSIKRTQFYVEGPQKKFAVSLAKLSEVTSSLAGEVVLEIGEALTIRSGRSRFKLPLVEANLEPPAVPDGQKYTLPLAEIRGMLEFSLLATGITANPFFACDMVLLKNSDEHYTAEGTDGQRLMIAKG